MPTKIAVATISGKAHYRLVSELKRKKIPFITIIPGKKIPLNIEIVITTEFEKKKDYYPSVLIYDDSKDPSIVVSKALQLIQRKQKYEKLIIGVDPGKKIGLAVMGDRAILESKSVLGQENAAVEVIKMIERFESDQKVVKIGNGAASYRRDLITILDKKLPCKVDMESVEEKGTTSNANIIFEKKAFKDTSSAIKIAMRRGHKMKRRNIHQLS